MTYSTWEVVMSDNGRAGPADWSARSLPRIRWQLLELLEGFRARLDRVPVAWAFKQQVPEVAGLDKVGGTSPWVVPRRDRRPVSQERVALSDAYLEAARTAELWWVTRDMTRVALDASRDIPDWVPSVTAPSPSGLLIWAEDLPPIPRMNGKLPGDVVVDGVMWTRVDDKLHITAVTRLDKAVKEGGTAESPPSPWTWFGVTPSYRVEVDADAVMDLASYGDFAGFLAAVGATWTLMQMPTIATPKTVTGSGGTGREWNQVDRTVTISTLRTAPTMRRPSEGGRKLTEHRWYVRGHWRQQPHGPAQSLRKTTWIPGYVKGPEGAPLIEMERVSVWSRI